MGGNLVQKSQCHCDYRMEGKPPLWLSSVPGFFFLQFLLNPATFLSFFHLLLNLLPHQSVGVILGYQLRLQVLYLEGYEQEAEMAKPRVGRHPGLQAPTAP